MLMVYFYGHGLHLLLFLKIEKVRFVLFWE